MVLAASATSREKRMPPPYWLRAWKRASWLRRLSGATSDPSTAARGVESWISSLRAIPVSRIPLPAGAREATTIAGCSIRFSGSWTRCGLIISSARTSRGTPAGSSPLPFQHWKAWATALRRVSSERWKLEPPISGNGFSSSPNWPSPDAGLHGGENRSPSPGATVRPNLTKKAEHWKTPNVPNGGRVNPPDMSPTGMTPDGRKKQVGLADEARAWRTPRTGQGDYHYDRGNPNKPTPTLEGQAKQWPSPMKAEAERGSGIYPRGNLTLKGAAQTWPTVRACAGKRSSGANRTELVEAWPTPAARGYRSGSHKKPEASIWGQKGRPLEVVACRSSPPGPEAPTGPPSLTPIPFSSLPSETCSSGTLLAELSVYRRWSERSGGAAGWRGTWTRQPRRSLNPWFVEFLLGWPLGWTACEPLATEFVPYKQRMRTALLTLCSPPPPPQGEMF